MAAPKGNQFWKARSSHGRNPIFPDSETLWNACLEYFDWAEKNPLLEEKVFHAQGEITRANVKKQRILTKIGLCNFLDISDTGWLNYSEREDFVTVCARAEKIIRQQGMEGAAGGLLEPGITARILGLADKKEVDATMRHTITEDPQDADEWEKENCQ